MAKELWGLLMGTGRNIKKAVNGIILLTASVIW
jgi:hypothetical protein